MIDVAGILLAAGAANRFGDSKLLHSLPNGMQIGVAAAQAIIQVVPNTVAVVRTGDHALIEAFSAIGLMVVENPLADEGMGTSLAAGVNATSEAGGWVIALADMPWVRPETIGMLANQLRSGVSMIAPVYRGRRGHPVGFSARWGEKLKALGGDEGARRLIAEFKNELVLQDTDDSGVLVDIDYPDDLKKNY